MASEAPPVAPHVEETVAKIAELHAAHYREAGALQKFASSATAGVAQPRTLERRREACSCARPRSCCHMSLFQ
jgi:Tfp pilus assembly protein PilN